MKRKLLLAVIFAVIFIYAAGQKSQALYFMDLPQNHLLNPALKLNGKFYVGFPGLTGVSLNVTNNFLNFSDVFTHGLKVSESTIPFLNSGFDNVGFLENIRRLNYFEPQVSLQVIGVGFTIKDYYVFLDINERFEANTVFPRDLVRLAFLGYEDFAGQTLDFAALKTDAKYYREIGVGFAEQVSSRLRIGVKGKLLFGIASVSYGNEVLRLALNNDGSNLLLADVRLQMSGPVSVFLSPEGRLEDFRFDNARFDARHGYNRFFANSRNPGFGLDIGAEYQINSKFTVSSALTDFGFIRWKTDVTNLNGHGNVNIDGIDFVDIQNGTATVQDLAESLNDSIRSSLTFTDSFEPYTTFLPFGITLAGKYNVTDNFSVGLLSYSRIVNKQFKEALTLSGNFYLGNVLSACLAYTLSNHSYNNLGIGIGVRGGFAQFYFLVDRIPVKWQKVGTNNGNFKLPANWHTINTMFGINFVFGNKAAKKLNNKETI